jgi:hypothetical protein
LLTVVRVEWEALYLKSVLVKEYWHIVMRFESLYVALNCPDILFFSDEIQLLHPASQDFSVDLFWKVVPVLGT